MSALPSIELCLASSIDGKLSSQAREPVRFPSRADRARLFALRDQADALLTGGATLRAEDPPLLPDAERRAQRVAAGLRPDPLRIVVSGSLDLPLGRALRAEAGAPCVVLTGPNPNALAAERLEAAGVRVLSSGAAGLDLAAALSQLAHEHGLRRVLCEGGGALAATLLADPALRAALSALHLTLCPLLLGGAQAPTLLDGEGFAQDAAPRFRLVECLQVEDELFLTYRPRASVDA